MRQFTLVLHVIGFVVILFACAMLVPLASAWFLDEPVLHAFQKSFLLTMCSGLVLFLAPSRALRRSQAELQPRDGFLLVSLVWIFLPGFATLPLMLSLPELTFSHAYFETMSGLTTTGATVLTNLDSLPASINLWRCLLVWIGGMGVLILAVAILPLLGVGGSQIYRAETSGPIKDSKLTPRITETAKGLYAIYILFSVLCFVCYRWAGMTWFDALCHMFSTMGLGGFSTHDTSFAYFKSPAIELVAVLFMLIAGISFTTHFLAWHRKSFTPYYTCPETRWFLAIVLGAVILVAVYLTDTGTYSVFSQALRDALFNVVSVATTTGFANTDYNQWPIFAPVLMLLLCCFASCTSSTGGGIKMLRAVLLFKQAKRELIRILHPRAINPVRLDGTIIGNQVIFAILAFMLMYGTSTIICTMLLLFSGLDVITAFTAVIACINNTGPGLNQVGPASTYALLSPFQSWVCVLAMLLGRLELFTVLVLFTAAFWRK